MLLFYQADEKGKFDKSSSIYIDIYKRHSDPNKKEKPTIESNDAGVKNVGNSFTFDGIKLHGGVLLNFFLLIKQVIEFIGICTSELRLLRHKTIVVDND